MPNLAGIAKYLGVLSIGKGIIDKVVIQRLLVGVAALVGLSAVAGLLIGALVVGLLAVLYSTMVHDAGVDYMLATVLVAALAISILSLIIYKIVKITKKISIFTSVIAQTATPISTLEHIVTSFVSGLKESTLKPKHTKPTVVKPSKFK